MAQHAQESPSPHHTPSGSARAASAPMQSPAFENGTGTAGHGTLQGMLNASPRTLALAQLLESVSQSPRMVAQRQSVAGMFGAVQLKELDEKPAVQAKSKLDEKNPAQRSVDGTARWKQDDKKKPAHGKMQAEAPPQLSAASETAQLKEAPAPDRTCLPDNLKSGVESLSGIFMDGVRVHRNSALPAQLNALAYAQSHDVHLGPGQEQHLPLEAQHVVQQTQGRVPPSRQTKGGVPVNDDKGLEHEADVMRSRAAQRRAGGAGSSVALRPATAGLVMQQKALVRDKLNVAGEYHPESGKRRDQEAAYTTEKTGGNYYKEGEFKTSKWALQSDRLGDPMLLRAEMLLAILREKMVARILTPFAANQVPPALGLNIPIKQAWDMVKGLVQSQLQEIATALYSAVQEDTEAEQAVKAAATFDNLNRLSGAMSSSFVKDVGSNILPEINSIIAGFAKDVLGLRDIRSESTVNQLRSKAMQEAAANNSERRIGAKKGVWKVGNDHIAEIKADKNTVKYELMTKDEFNEDFVPWVQLKYPEWFYTTFTVPAVKTAVQGLGAVLDKYPDSHWSVTPKDRQGALEGLTKLKDAWNGIKDEDRRSNAGIVIAALDRYFMAVDRRRPSQEVMWEEKGFTKPPK